VQFSPPDGFAAECDGNLVTEGVRCEAGILTTKKVAVFNFYAIPENYRTQTADNEETAGVIVRRQRRATSAELLPAIMFLALQSCGDQEGQGEARIAAFYLDISWIKQKLPTAPNTLTQTPSHVSQFKQLADLISQATPWR